MVIDMVPFFDGPYTRGVIPQIQALAGALRESGGLVAWVLPGPGGPHAAREEFSGPRVAELYRTSGSSGPLAGRLWPQLTVDESRDLLVEKAVSGAFFPGYCPLPDAVRSQPRHVNRAHGDPAELGLDRAHHHRTDERTDRDIPMVLVRLDPDLW
ncbi:hypothetical protein [Kitasatospora sp. NPDC057223]|uniref:hypothetical protein n=1 Tax=Kitasatospora sp. NPDC057223 TaxID=3346055 RepID=UPI003634F827